MCCASFSLISTRSSLPLTTALPRHGEVVIGHDARHLLAVDQLQPAALLLADLADATAEHAIDTGVLGTELGECRAERVGLGVGGDDFAITACAIRSRRRRRLRFIGDGDFDSEQREQCETEMGELDHGGTPVVVIGIQCVVRA